MTFAEVADFVLSVPRLDLWGAALGVVLTVALLAGLAHVAMGADREQRQQISIEATIERVLEQHGLDLHAGDPSANKQPIDLAMYARLAEVPDPRKLETATPEEIHRCYDSIAQKDPRLAGRLTRDAMLRRRQHLEKTTT
jgi:hypothetical protein